MMYRRDLVDDGSLTRPEQVRGRRIALSGFDAVQEFIIMAQIPMAWTGAAATTVEQGFQGQDFFFHYHPWEYQNADSSLAR